MTISLGLSDKSIQKAIRELEKVKDNLDFKVGEVVDALASQGADVAQEAFGRMAKAGHYMESEKTAKIELSGKAPGVAEFGAGYATMEYHPFAKNAPYPVEVGSYSRENDGFFALTDWISPGEGYWVFWTGLGHSAFYDRVQPRHGLLNAYDWLMQNSSDIAKEVVKLD